MLPVCGARLTNARKQMKTFFDWLLRRWYVPRIDFLRLGNQILQLHTELAAERNGNDFLERRRSYWLTVATEFQARYARISERNNQLETLYRRQCDRMAQEVLESQMKNVQGQQIDFLSASLGDLMAENERLRTQWSGSYTAITKKAK